jgi:hypothetical protein
MPEKRQLQAAMTLASTLPAFIARTGLELLRRPSEELQRIEKLLLEQLARDTRHR